MPYDLAPYPHTSCYHFPHKFTAPYLKFLISKIDHHCCQEVPWSPLSPSLCVNLIAPKPTLKLKDVRAYASHRFNVNFETRTRPGIWRITLDLILFLLSIIKSVLVLSL
ncbi:hypothetical protein V6Z12_D11G268600 [Gossypium hirsutum]